MYQRKELQVGKRKPVLQVPDFGDSTTGIISGCGVKAVTERGKVVFRKVHKHACLFHPAVGRFFRLFPFHTSVAK